MTTPICETLKQSQRLLQIQTPPTRYDPPNPYLMGYTQFQLNMRRKAEILRYDPIRQPNQTNSLTKAQRWGQVVSGKYQKQSYTKINTVMSDGITPITTIYGTPVNLEDQYITLDCPDNKLNVLTSTTSCDVPGEVIQLYNDGTTPIYMIANNKSPYAFQVTPVSTPYYSSSYNNISTTLTYALSSNTSNFENTTVSNTFASLYIVHPIQDTMTFAMSLPISIYVGGSIALTNTVYPGSNGSPLGVSIQGITLSALYGSKVYTITPEPTFQYDASDASFNILSTNTTFYASCSIGQLKISNIQMPTITGYIYDFQLCFHIHVTLPDNYFPKFNAITAGVICNVTQDISLHANHIRPAQPIGATFSISSS